MDPSRPREPGDAAADRPRPKTAPREQEQSIRARKQLIFGEEELPGQGRRATTKPFSEYLRTTPPAPLSTATKAMLWAVGAVVVLLLIAVLLKAR